MLKPDDAAVDPAVVAVGPQLAGQFLEHLVGAAVDGASPVGGELVGEEFSLPAEAGPEDVGLVAGLEGEGGVVRVDDTEVAEQQVQLHDPEGVAAQVAPDAAGRKVPLLGSKLLVVQLHDEVAVLAVRPQTKHELLPLLAFLRRARRFLAEPLQHLPPLDLVDLVEVEPLREQLAGLWRLDEFLLGSF